MEVENRPGLAQARASVERAVTAINEVFFSALVYPVFCYTEMKFETGTLCRLRASTLLFIYRNRCTRTSRWTRRRAAVRPLVPT
jgi:hypothetical protein